MLHIPIPLNLNTRGAFATLSERYRHTPGQSVGVIIEHHGVLRMRMTALPPIGDHRDLLGSAALSVDCATWDRMHSVACAVDTIEGGKAVRTFALATRKRVVAARSINGRWAGFVKAGPGDTDLTSLTATVRRAMDYIASRHIH